MIYTTEQAMAFIRSDPSAPKCWTDLVMSLLADRDNLKNAALSAVDAIDNAILEGVLNRTERNALEDAGRDLQKALGTGTIQAQNQTV